MKTHFISSAKTFRTTTNASLILGILTVVSAALVYARAHPDFSIFTTYLSDIGDTAGWPQILFNTGTLLAAPLRYAIIVLIVLRLRSFSKKRGAFEVAFLTIGAFSTLGTVLMTAVPFSVGPNVHKSGIGLYFLGVVFLQVLLGLKELSIKQLPRILPVLSFTIVASYVWFLILVILYETGSIGRNVPVFWEWMCFFTSMAWLVGHGFILGKEQLDSSTI